MIACLVGKSSRLAELARQFSPVIENTADDEVVFSIEGLGTLFGDVHRIAAEIGRRGVQMELRANLAIAANKSTARLAARHYRGVTIVKRGSEAHMLAPIPIEALPTAPDICETLLRWGINTLGGLAALPEAGVRERLGETGAQLRRLALGRGEEIIAIRREATNYVVRREMDEPIEQLEPLLFILSAHLHDLMGRLCRDGYAASGIELTLTLEGGSEFVRRIELPVATRDPLALLKQLQLSLDAKPPGAGVCIAQTALLPSDPRVVQSGLFQPPTPEPDKLQTLLTRLRALAGVDKVGSPEILNTHRPDAFRMRPCAFEPSDPLATNGLRARVAFRYFRPPLEARVILQGQLPIRVLSQRVSGRVVQAAGPWRNSGGMWAHLAWNRDEWDVVLDDYAVYRIYLTGKRWFLCGSYD